MKIKNILLNIILAIFIIFITIIIFLNIKNRPTIIFPNKNISSQIYEIIDSKNKNGKSKIIKNNITENEIYFEYILNEGSEYPFVGLGIKLGESDKFIDLSQYKYIKIKLITSLKRKYRFSLKTNNLNPKSNKKNKSDQYRTLVKYIETPVGEEVYKILLNEFETPSWWFKKNKYVKFKSDSDALKEVFAIDIMDIKNYPIISKYQHGIVKIINISFYKSNNFLFPVLLLSIGIFIIFFLIRIYFVFLKKIINTKSASYNHTYKKIELNNYEEINFNKISQYIKNNYNKPDLSLNDIQNETGVRIKKISSIIKKKHGLSFKQLINQIRIKESKRLLTETDRDITEIAFHLGFNSLPYFYQVFKEQEKMSPRKYRKMNKTKKRFQLSE